FSTRLFFFPTNPIASSSNNLFQLCHISSTGICSFSCLYLRHLCVPFSFHSFVTLFHPVFLFLTTGSSLCPSMSTATIECSLTQHDASDHSSHSPTFDAVDTQIRSITDLPLLVFSNVKSASAPTPFVTNKPALLKIFINFLPLVSTTLSLLLLSLVSSGPTSFRSSPILELKSPRTTTCEILMKLAASSATRFAIRINSAAVVPLPVGGRYTAAT